MLDEPKSKEIYMSAKVTRFILVLVFFIPVFLNAAQVKQKGFRFDTPWLGVMLSDVSEKTLKNMGLENGVKISKVFKDSPADKAGLEIGDIIVSFDGKKVSNPNDLSNQVNMKKVNDQIDLKYFRDGKMNSTKVLIEKRKSPQVFMKKAPQIIKKKFHHSQNSVFLGVKVEQLSDQLREYFNVSNELGVLISEVIKDSPAEKAGMKAGDVITKVEDREVKSYRDLIRGLNYFDPNDEVKVYFIREKKLILKNLDKYIRKLGNILLHSEELDIVSLFEEYAWLKDLLDHHDAREKAFLFPILDARMPDSSRQEALQNISTQFKQLRKE